MRFALISNLIVLSAIFFGNTVLASEDEAKALFAEASELFENREYPKAALKFREAYAIKPTWKLLYNIGQSEAAAKRYGLALEAFEEYLTDAGDEIPVERQKEVRAEAARLREMVGTLDVRAPAGAVIIIDAIRRGIAPVVGGFPVAAGKTHTVVALVDGKTFAHTRARARVGTTVEVDLTRSTEENQVALPLQPDEPSPELSTGNDAPPVITEAASPAAKDNTFSSSAATPASRDKARSLRIAGWIAAGTGAAMIAGGAVTGAVAMSKNNELKDNCVDNICGPGFEDIEMSRDNLGLTSTVLFAAGGAVAAAGVIMLLISHRSQKERPVTLQPTAHRNFVGGRLEWAF